MFPLCPLSEKFLSINGCWIFVMYTMEWHSAIRKNEIMSFAATCMDIESVILSKVSQRSIVWHPLYVESKKKWYKWTYYRTETDSQTELMVARRGEWGKGYLGNLEWACTHCYIENRSPTRSHCIAYETILMLCGSLDGRGVWGTMDTCNVYNWVLHCSPETITTLLICYTPIKKNKK